MNQDQILEAIRKERGRQDAIWGGLGHDQDHPPEDWCAFINLQLGKVRDSPTERFIKIAALAVAAIEAEAARDATCIFARVANLRADEQEARRFELEHTDCDDPECPRHGASEEDDD
jgi:hypothetical protein